MAQVNPYFTFNGTCEAAFEFYKSVFGGEYRDFNRFGDMPAQPGQQLSESTDKLIMHVALPISKETILMGSDSHPMFPPVVVGQHLSVSVGTDSKEEADKIFNGLGAGGKITMPIADTFWGAYFGMLEDKFGISWLVNYDAPKP